MTVREFWHRLVLLLRRERVSEELEEEMRLHIQLRTEANRRAGMSADAAASAARRSFGNRGVWQMVSRETWGFGALESVAQDLRYAVRTLRRHKLFALVAVGILALGVGAAASVFQFVDALLLTPPPVRAPSELVQLWNSDPRAPSELERYSPLSYPQYAFYRDQARTVSGLLAFDGDPAMLSWARPDGATVVQAQFVSANFFSLLGVGAATGRMFDAQDDRDGSAGTVAVVSHRFWRERLGAVANVAGTSITVNGVVITIAGVAPQGFEGLLAGIAPELWLPLSATPAVRHEPDVLTSRSSFWLFAVGRLREGTRKSQAQSEFTVIAGQLAAENSEFKGLVAAVFPATLVPGPYRIYVSAFAGLLQVVVGLVLVVACANATNLFLALAVSRQPEMAIRTSLGASRGRLIRQSIVEGSVIAIAAAAGGLAVARLAAPFMLRLLPPTLPVSLTLTMDWRVGMFTVGLALVAGLVVGALPALRGTTRGVSGAGRANGVERTPSRLRAALVIVQVSASVVLLVSGALCWRGLRNAIAVDRGFELRGRTAFRLDVRNVGYGESAGRAFYRRLLQQVATVPGVAATGLASFLPLESASMQLGIDIPGRVAPQSQKGLSVLDIDVGPGFFKAMGTPLVGGRDFSEHDDMSSERVLLVNEPFVNRFWPGQDAMGRGVVMKEGMTERTTYRIVGVVKTGKYRTLAERPRPMIFRALAQHYSPQATLVVQSSTDGAATVAAVRSEVARIEPNLAVEHAGTLEEHLALALFPSRATAILLAVAGLVGLSLAVAGLIAVVAYTVARRTREIGIRMALGAQRADILREIAGAVVRQVALGSALGALAAFAATRALSGVLVGISATDPSIFAGTIAGLFAVSVSACLLTARRATAIDPMTALRRD